MFGLFQRTATQGLDLAGVIAHEAAKIRDDTRDQAFWHVRLAFCTYAPIIDVLRRPEPDRCPACVALIGISFGTF